MNAPVLTSSGLLELGRHPATLTEIRQALVDDPQFAASISRTAIWQHFERANELLQSAAVVHAAWIGGSFTTNKLNPRDIDVVYIINENDRAGRSDDDLRVIESFVARVPNATTGKPEPAHRLLVDSFVVPWSPHLGSMRSSAPYQAYAQSRGYWDDFWLRSRTGSKKAPLAAADALPRRGYMEVQFSAYIP